MLDLRPEATAPIRPAQSVVVSIRLSVWMANELDRHRGDLRRAEFMKRGALFLIAAVQTADDRALPFIAMSAPAPVKDVTR